jgi:hypothetical protein
MSEILGGYSVDETRDFARRAIYGAPFDSQKPSTVAFIDPDKLSAPIPEQHWPKVDGEHNPYFGFGYGHNHSTLPRHLRHLKPLLGQVLEVENERSGAADLYVRLDQFKVIGRHPQARPMHIDYGISTRRGDYYMFVVPALYLASGPTDTTHFAVGHSSGVEVPPRTVVSDADRHYSHFNSKAPATITFDDIYRPEPGEVVITNGFHQSPDVETDELRTVLRIYPDRQLKENTLLPRYVSGELGRSALLAYAEGEAV